MACKQTVRSSFTSVLIVCIWADAPHGTYWRSGHNNNHVFVFPAWNMVIARLGLDGRKSRGGLICRMRRARFDCDGIIPAWALPPN